MSGDWIEIGPSKVRTWRAAPRDARRGGVVVIQEVFGVSAHIRAICDAFAEHGYEALAPAIFRSDPDFVADEVNDASIAKGRALVEATPLDGALADCQTLVNALASEGAVFMTGFCYGGSLSWLAAQRLAGLAAISSFYGRFAPDHLDAPLQAPTICHFGKTDSSIPLDRVEKLAAAYPDVPVFLYDAGHGFMRQGDHYHADSAKLAWLRTLQLFQRNSGARTDA